MKDADRMIGSLVMSLDNACISSGFLGGVKNYFLKKVTVDIGRTRAGKEKPMG